MSSASRADASEKNPRVPPVKSVGVLISGAVNMLIFSCAACMPVIRLVRVGVESGQA